MMKKEEIFNTYSYFIKQGMNEESALELTKLIVNRKNRVQVL